MQTEIIAEAKEAPVNRDEEAPLSGEEKAPLRREMELPARESVREIVDMRDSVNESPEYPVSPIKGNMPITSAIELEGQQNAT